MKHRILVIEDHEILRDGIRLILRDQPDFEVVGEAGDGETALQRAGELAPDLALVDLGLPCLGGLDLIRSLRDRFPRIRLLILSAESDEDLVRRAVQLGVAAYLVKTNAATELIHALRAVADGKAYFSPEIASLLAAGYCRVLDGGVSARLSDRERQVVRLIAEGRNTKEVAYELRLSAKTVESHRRNIMRKLGLFSVAELTKYAIRERLVRL